MHLLVSVALLFILLTGGYSLKCYDDKQQMTCPSGSSKCASFTTALYTGSSKNVMKHKTCIKPEQCVSYSLNDGKKTAVSTKCCDTDLCNTQDASDLSSDVLNGKTCFTCNENNCSAIIKCSGNEDYCLSVQENGRNLSGYASKSYCDLAPTIMANFNNIKITCCKGNLCNGAKSVTQSFLLLLCPLLTFFLFQ